MAGCVRLKTGGSKFRSRGLNMRFSLAVAVVLASMSVNGLAQQSGNGTSRVKPSHSAAKASAPSRSAGKRTPGMAPALKPAKEKDKPNPPINFHGTGGSKSPGMTNQGTNPYKGRLRQKHSHQ